MLNFNHDHDQIIFALNIYENLKSELIIKTDYYNNRQKCDIMGRT